MYSTTDFRKGLKIEVEGTPYEIIEFQHFKPGKGGAMVRTKPASSRQSPSGPGTRSGYLFWRPAICSTCIRTARIWSSWI